MATVDESDSYDDINSTGDLSEGDEFNMYANPREADDEEEAGAIEDDTPTDRADAETMAAEIKRMTWSFTRKDLDEMSPEDRAAIEQTRLSHKISQAKPKLKRGVARRMKSPLQALSVAGLNPFHDRIIHSRVPLFFRIVPLAIG